jgi:hypothetical protein
MEMKEFHFFISISYYATSFNRRQLSIRQQNFAQTLERIKKEFLILPFKKRIGRVLQKNGVIFDSFHKNIKDQLNNYK